MFMNNDDIIPVDDAIERFQIHLLSSYTVCQIW